MASDFSSSRLKWWFLLAKQHRWLIDNDAIRSNKKIHQKEKNKL